MWSRGELFDLDALDDDYPSTRDRRPGGTPLQARDRGIDDIREVWESEPLFYPAKLLADQYHKDR